MSERREIIDKLSAISDSLDKDLKPLIQKLAKNIGDNIKHPEIINMCKILGINDPELHDVSSIIQRLKKKHNWAFGTTTLLTHIPVQYKREYGGEKKEEYSNPVRINDNMITPDNFDKIESLLKKYKKANTPAKEIITKARKEDMETYTWKCHTANELALLALKMEADHDADKHDDKLCKEYAKRAKMVRDSRFATDANSYEAIILACNSTQSLKNSIKGEWEFKTIWEIKDDEDKCRECIKSECRASKCNHECHRVVRPMTTKGLKYAIKTNDDLAALDKHVKRLTTIDNDICRIGKMLLENPKTKKLLGVVDIKKMMYSHVDKDECLACDLFLENHPEFFDQWK